MRERLLCCLVALLFAASFRASAANIEIVKFTSTRDDVLIRGPIKSGDDQKFRQIVTKHLKQGGVIAQVRVYSTGGDVDAAISIGKQIQTLGAGTWAPAEDVAGRHYCFIGDWRSFARTTSAPGRETGPSCTCVSACALIWFAGYPRGGRIIGIHAPRYDEVFYAALSPGAAEDRYKEVTEEIRAYLKTVDVPDFVFREMFGTDSRHMHFLVGRELAQVTKNDAGLQEYEFARCGKYDSHSRTGWDCVEKAEMDRAVKGARKYLQVYGSDLQ